VEGKADFLPNHHLQHFLFETNSIVVVKKTFLYPNVFFYYRNTLFLQPLMPQSFIPEHFYGKGYKSIVLKARSGILGTLGILNFRHFY
jgi:hypothetical protein